MLNALMSPMEVRHSVNIGNKLAETIRNGTYKPHGKPRHKQTPVALGEFRFPLAIASMARKIGANAAAETALELAAAPGLTITDANRWIARITAPAKPIYDATR